MVRDKTSSSESFSTFNVWCPVLEGGHIGVILNTWKQLDNLKRKHTKDTNQEFCESGMGRRSRTNGGKVPGYMLNMEMVSTKLTNSIFDNIVLPGSLQFWVSDIPSFMGFGWRGLATSFQKTIFSRVPTESSQRFINRSPSAQPHSTSVTETLSLDFRFYLHPSRSASFLSLKGLGGETTFLRILHMSLGQAQI